MEMPLAMSFKSRVTILIRFVPVIFLVAVATGCGKPVGAAVSGVVTIDGRPAPAGIRVDFEPQVANASSSTGYTDAEGRYTMMFNAAVAGVMPGENVVRLSVAPVIDSRTGKPEIPEALKGILVPDSLGQNMTLRKTVKPGKNSINIAIESDAASGK
jgi:hypothetical protein